MPVRPVVAACAALVPALGLAQPVVPLHLRCASADPEWRLEAGPEAAVLRRADPKPSEETFRGELLRLVSPQWDGAAWRGASGGAPSRTLAVAVRREACTDGPATTNARGVVVAPDGAPLAGCCTATFGYDLARAPLADPGRKSADDWSGRLPSLVGAVRACVADAPGAVERVASVRVADSGRVTIRTVDPRGALNDCEVDASRRRVLGTRAVPDAAAVAPTAESPVLWPAREPPPVIDCGRVERVLERGRVFGWLQYGPC